MASIYKLSISGVRSFTGETQETIQFGKPLTLIVGTNGSGKTTIIECLRYATTGELPPGTKNGASFINDPNLHGGRDTKAQVKLAFESVDGKSMIITKALMASANPRTNSISFKTKENQLVVLNHGEKRTISSKVNDMETLIPQHLGVSKAILNYVIFCHQDESLWPISDSATLKKKFDEIFDSVKFIKILENIKQITKELNVEIKLINNNVVHLKNDRHRAHQKMDEIERINKDIKQFNQEVEDASKEIQQIDEELNTLYNSNQDYEKVLNKIEMLKETEKSLELQIHRIESTTDLINRPPHELQDLLNNFSNMLAQKRDNAETLTKVINSTNQQLEILRNQYLQNSSAEGTLKAHMEQFEKNKREKTQLISTISEKFEVQDPSKLEEAMADYAAKIDTSYNEQMELIQRQSEDFDFDISTSKEEILKLKQQNSYHTDSIRTLESKKKSLESKLENIRSNESQLKSYEHDLKNKEKEYADKHTSNPVDKLVKEIFSKREEIDGLESSLQKNQDNFSRATNLNEKYTEKKILSEVVADCNYKKDDYLQQVSGAYSEVLSEDFDFENSNFKGLFDRRVYNLNEEHEKLQNELEKVKDKERNINISLSRVRETRDMELKENKRCQESLRRTLQSYNEIYDDSLSLETFVADYNTITKDTQSTIRESRSDIANRESMLKYYQKVDKRAKKHKSCSLCSRSLDEREFLEFIAMVKKHIERYGEPDELIRSLKDDEKLLAELTPLQSDVESYKNFQVDKYDTKINSYEAELANVLEEKISLVTKIDKVKHMTSSLKSVSENINELARIKAELEEKTYRISQIDSEIQEEYEISGQNLSLDDLKKEQVEIQNNLREARGVLNKLSEDKERNMRILNRLESTIKDLRLSISQKKMESTEKENIEKSISETEEQIMKSKEVVTGNKQQLTLHESELRTKVNEFDLFKKDANEKKKEIQGEKDEIEVIKFKLKRFDQEIEGFVKSGGESQYDSVKAESIRLRGEIKSTEQTVLKQSSELKTLEEQLNDTDKEERRIRFTMDWNSLRDDKTQIESQIFELEKQNAEANREEFLQKSNELQEKRKQTQYDYSLKIGQATELKKQIDSINRELEKEYGNIDDKYTKEFARLQTKLALVTDLTTCYKATDNGVMQFHQFKMKQINRTLDELWKRTYMGNDIEAIMVKADPVVSKKDSTTRSYNYRVVMIKNGVELDMRGRCSAGQRVLASIIIRLALAENFGTNFGVIALDEPTTNLDEENIDSLARSLNTLVALRRAQSNFQIIVITHDESFLRHMGANQYTEHYYKVARDQRLNSTISQVRISQMD